jgi:hypothetical protein
MLMTSSPARRAAVRRERAPLRMRAVVAQVVTKRLGALPVVAEFLHRLGVAETMVGFRPGRTVGCRDVTSLQGSWVIYSVSNLIVWSRFVAGCDRREGRVWTPR